MSRSAVWLGAVASLTLTLGMAATAWWFTRGAERAVKEPEAQESVAEPSDTEDPKVGYALALARDGSYQAIQKLIDFYGRAAADPGAIEARQIALAALFEHRSLGLRLQRVLEAVEGDPTPPESDPLWSHVVDRLAEQWTPEALDKGRDLMLMHEKPRARRALVASFIRYSELHLGELSLEQRQTLTTDFIDVYPLAEPAQQPDVLATVRKLSGNSDVADILAGQVLRPGFKLQAELDHERQMAATAAQLRTAAVQE